MRTLSILISILIINGTLILAAQFTINPGNEHELKNHYNQYDSILLDSIIRFSYKSINDSSPVHMTSFEYDWKGNQNLIIEYTRDKEIPWDSASPRYWCWITRHEKEFDEKGNMISNYIKYNSLKSEHPDWIQKFSYDENGHVISLEALSFDEANNRWIPQGGKLTFEYNENGDTINATHYYYAVWSSGYRILYYDEWLYDEENRLIQWSKKNGFDGETSEVKNYYYDENGILLKHSHLIYGYVLEQRWVMGHQYEYIHHPFTDIHEYYYNAYGNDTLYTSMRRYEACCGYQESWRNMDTLRRTYEYDEKGYLSRQTEYESNMKEFIYSESGILLMEAEYQWDDSIRKWEGIHKWKDEYDSDDRIKYHSEFYWNYNTLSWFISLRDIYHYSKHTIVVGNTPVQEKQSVQIYPNPSDGWIWVELTEQVDFRAEVYSVTGQKVRTMLIKNGHAALNLTGLNPGTYLLILTTNETIYSNHILIK